MTRRNKAINFIFWNAVLCSCLYGYGWTKSTTFALILGLLSLLMIYVGMVLAFIVADEREEGKRLKIEQDCQLHLKNMVEMERLNCAKGTINIARAMTSAVANIITAKYVDGLDNEMKRLFVLNDLRDIIENETALLSRSLLDDLNVVKES